jgi:hypothetical protein
MISQKKFLALAIVVGIIGVVIGSVTIFLSLTKAITP